MLPQGMRHLHGSTREDGRTSGKEATAKKSCEHAAGVLIGCYGKRLEKQSVHTFKDKNKHNYIGDTLQEDSI